MKHGLIQFGLVTILALTLAQCASSPPNLSPAATAAFNNTRIIKSLDLLRDTAIEANAQERPLISEATTRKVVTWHRSTLLIIKATSFGWQATVQTGLEQLIAGLPAGERALLSPYVGLAKALITEVTR